MAIFAVLPVTPRGPTGIPPPPPTPADAAPLFGMPRRRKLFEFTVRLRVVFDGRSHGLFFILLLRLLRRMLVSLLLASLLARHVFLLLNALARLSR